MNNIYTAIGGRISDHAALAISEAIRRVDLVSLCPSYF